MPSEATDAMAEEVVLNAAVAFAGHVATAAQEAADKVGTNVNAPLREAVLRQYLLETATLCLRRLGESYEQAVAETEVDDVRNLARDGAAQARAAGETVEALGDLALDLLDHLLK